MIPGNGPGQAQQIDAALSQIFGMHGAWVLSLEKFEEGEFKPRLWQLNSSGVSGSTAWTLIGMLHSHINDLEDQIREFK